MQLSLVGDFDPIRLLWGKCSGHAEAALLSGSSDCPLEMPFREESWPASRKRRDLQGAVVTAAI